MAGHCCAATPKPDKAANDPRWRRVLWTALVANLLMFGVEVTAGALAGSRALQADALDFLGDAANYAISLGVAGMALAWRARTALVKGVTIFLFGWAVAIAALWGMVSGTSPDPWAMTGIGALALLVNVTVAAMLFRYRSGDANMRSVWICSRNDAINNGLVIAAGVLVLWTGSGWPDLIVAMIMAVLGISGGWQVIRQALAEINGERGHVADEAQG
jgi:Co/Zn/Cd efflux system component